MIYEPFPFKRCNRCHRYLLKTKFHRHRSMKDGLHRECRECRSEAIYPPAPMGFKRCSKCKEIYRETDEFFYRNRYAHNGLTTQCKECCKKRAAEQRQKIDKSKSHEYQIKWQEKNREKVRETNRNWHKMHPGETRARKEKRRKRIILSGGAYTKRDISAQYKRQKGRCYWCGVHLRDKYHIDHVIPLSRGGSNGPENIVISCPQCNESKGNKLPHEWHGNGGKLL